MHVVSTAADQFPVTVPGAGVYGSRRCVFAVITLLFTVQQG